MLHRSGYLMGWLSVLYIYIYTLYIYTWWAIHVGDAVKMAVSWMRLDWDHLVSGLLEVRCHGLKVLLAAFPWLCPENPVLLLVQCGPVGKMWVCVHACAHMPSALEIIKQWVRFLCYWQNICSSGIAYLFVYALNHNVEFWFLTLEDNA